MTYSDTPDGRQSITRLRRMYFIEFLKNADKMKNDSRKPQRLYLQRCKMCFYIPRLGGNAITPYQCARCQQTFDSANTDLPVLCPKCARATEQCVLCGAQIDYVEGSPNEAPQAPPKAPDDL